MPLFDPGAQAERTALAWRRTGLGLVGVGALLLHSGGDGPAVLSLGVGAADVATGAVLAGVVAPARYRRTLADVTAGRTPLARWSSLAATACALATAAAAAVELVETL